MSGRKKIPLRSHPLFRKLISEQRSVNRLRGSIQELERSNMINHLRSYASNSYNKTALSPAPAGGKPE